MARGNDDGKRLPSFLAVPANEGRDTRRDDGGHNGQLSQRIPDPLRTPRDNRLLEDGRDAPHHAVLMIVVETDSQTIDHCGRGCSKRWDEGYRAGLYSTAGLKRRL